MRDRRTSVVNDRELIQRAIDEKWQPLVDLEEGVTDEGEDNCALCQAYPYICMNSTGESTCPVYADTNKTLCEGSPYREWRDHQHAHRMFAEPGTHEWVVHCDECLRLAQAEVDYLKQLALRYPDT